MPTVDVANLQTLTARIFEGLGASEEDAAWIAKLLVLANLRGHDSHGVIRISQYTAAVRAGEVNPKASIEIVRETPVLALVDGHWGFGQVVAKKAMEVAIAKTKTQGVSVVGVFREYHIGRLADYAELAVKEGLLAMLAVNAGGAGLSVAPYGGITGRLATNPMAFGIPTGKEHPILLDMATSVAAEGKLRVKAARKEPVPAGWIIDSQGHPTTDSAKFYEKPPGFLLPLGGHKGYGLALAVEVLAGILTGAGYSQGKPVPIQNGIFILVLDVNQFLPLEAFRAQVDDLIRFVKESPKAKGVEAILVPGEPETLTEQRRRQEGIFVEEATWDQIQRIAAELGVA